MLTALSAKARKLLCITHDYAACATFAVRNDGVPKNICQKIQSIVVTL